MNKQLQDTILSFTQSTPRTVADITKHIHATTGTKVACSMVGKYMRELEFYKLIKLDGKQKIKTAWCNQYSATKAGLRILQAESNRKVTTPLLTFKHPLMPIL